MITMNKKLFLIFIFSLLTIVVFVNGQNYFLCTNPSCDPDVEQVLYAVSGICDWKGTIYVNSYNPSRECDSWKYKFGTPPSGYRLVCDWTQGSYNVNGMTFNLKLSYYYCKSYSCCHFLCQDKTCKCYNPTTDCSLSSCPSGYTKRVYLGCENKQKIYDVYFVSYKLEESEDGPYCKKVENYLRKDYQSVECCVNDDCPQINIEHGWKEGICSNFKCEYITYCDPGYKLENGECVPEITPQPPEENITPPENITPSPPTPTPQPKTTLTPFLLGIFSVLIILLAYVIKKRWFK